MKSRRGPIVLLVFPLLALVIGTAQASPENPSPVRGERESFEQAAIREGRAFSPAVASNKEAPVQDVAEGYLDFDPTDVPLWETDERHDPAALSALFDEIRDQRIYHAWDDRNFARRMAFLYPDDGCHVRAALFNQELERRGFARGHKIFVFGDLRVPTPHHPDGEVLWWFHVAPIFRMKQGLMVVDPALFPKGPVRFKEWMKFLAPQGDPLKLRLVTCDPLAHNPHSRCFGGGPGMDQGSARQHEEELLSFEWNRQLRLKRDPRVVLGDAPPWKAGIARP